MIRRDFLKLAAAFPFAPRETTKDFGYCPPDKEVNLPTFQETYPDVEDGAGEIALLHPYLERVLAVQSLPSDQQTGPDCVSHASGMAVNALAAVQTFLRNERWNGTAATEWLHFGGRCHIGGAWGISGGTQIIHTCNFLNQYGTLFRKKYPSVDFTDYRFGKSDLNKLEDWPGLIKEGEKHKVLTLTRVTNWEEVRAALKNLCPIVIGSTYGFDGAVRDNFGFAEPRGTWYHAWMLMGFDDRFQRPGALLMNSHGDHWVKGPRRHNQPLGSVWIGKEVVNDMLSDGYAISNYQGTKPNRFPLR